jgi:HlyD family secretion protein
LIKEKIIKPGISNWDYTEILSGLEKDEKVVVNVDQAGVKDGIQGVIQKEAK